MSARAPQHLLRPDVLASLSTLDLVARAVVEGFLTGMHRSPYFGFSQEFAEYRATFSDHLDLVVGFAYYRELGAPSS